MTRSYLISKLLKLGWEQSPGCAHLPRVWRKSGPWMHFANACEEAGLGNHLNRVLLSEQETRRLAELEPAF